jgi:hypothetical protein
MSQGIQLGMQAINLLGLGKSQKTQSPSYPKVMVNTAGNAPQAAVIAPQAVTATERANTQNGTIITGGKGVTGQATLGGRKLLG